MVNISVIVDDSNLKAATSPNNDTCKTHELLTNIYEKCRYVLLISDTTITTKQPKEVPISIIIDEQPEQQSEQSNCT